MENCLIVNSLYKFGTPSYQRLCGVIILFYSPVIIAINTLLIASIIATKQSLKSTSNLLIVFLCLSDVTIGAIFVPLQGIENIWYDDPRICAIKTATPALQAFCFGNSMGITMLLTIDRYLHMNPDFHRSSTKLAKSFRRPWIFGLLLVVCLISAITALTLHFAIINGLEWMLSVNLFFVVYCTITMVTITALYTRGYMRIRLHLADNPVYANREDPNENPEYLNALFKTVLLLIIALYFSWLSALVLNIVLVSAYFNDSNNFPPPAAEILYITSPFLFNTNSITNAAIIFYRNKKSRDWLMKKVFGCCRMRGRHAEEQNPADVVRNMRVAGV